jgi:hypothetical protein
MGMLVIEMLILILCMALLILLLGLPLLVRPDSPIPDMIGFGILTFLVLAFVWSSGAYWIILPILALVGFVAWLDREGKSGPESCGGGECGLSDRTKLRLRLWRAAIGLQFALLVGVVAQIATGIGMRSMDLVPWMLVTMVATVAFRFSFYRSCRRDQRALAGGETRRVEAAG